MRQRNRQTPAGPKKPSKKCLTKGSKSLGRLQSVPLGQIMSLLRLQEEEEVEEEEVEEEEGDREEEEELERRTPHGPQVHQRRQEDEAEPAAPLLPRRQADEAEGLCHTFWVCAPAAEEGMYKCLFWVKHK